MDARPERMKLFDWKFGGTYNWKAPLPPPPPRRLPLEEQAKPKVWVKPQKKA